MLKMSFYDRKSQLCLSISSDEKSPLLHNLWEGIGRREPSRSLWSLCRQQPGIYNYTFQNVFHHLYPEHNEYLQFCEFVSDHVAHSPGLILSTLSQGRHHLWNLVKKMLNINTSANLVPNANRKRDLPAVPRLQSGEVRQWRHKPPQPEASQSPEQQAIGSILFEVQGEWLYGTKLGYKYQEARELQVFNQMYIDNSCKNCCFKPTMYNFNRLKTRINKWKCLYCQWMWSLEGWQNTRTQEREISIPHLGKYMT